MAHARSESITTLARSILAAFLLAAAAAAPVPTAAAQQVDGKTLFDRAAEAIQDAKSLRVRVKVAGEGSLGDGFMPAGEGTADLVRLDDPMQDLAFAVRVRGSGSETPQTVDPGTIGMVLKPSETIWIDNRKEALVKKPQTRALVEDSVTLLNLLFIEQLVQREPFKRERTADTIEVLDPQSINGVMCDVVKLTYDPDKRPSPAAADQQNPSKLGQEATWYFARSDGLPRKIETVHNAQNIIVLRFNQEVLDIQIDPEPLTLDDLTLDAPEGFEVIDFSSLRQTRSNDRNAVPGPTPGRSTAKQPPKPAEPEKPQRPNAPAFELVTAEGDTVTKASGEGRIRVLYFWGTWCVPCRRISPKISELAIRLEDHPVDVYGVAVRERALERAVAYHEEQGYAYTMLVHPDSPRSDAVARDYQVRLYPTAVVIDAEGGIVGVVTPERDTPADGYATKVENFVTEALADLAAASVEDTD